MKEIRGFENYFITKEGEVISKRTNKPIFQWVDSCGYKLIAMSKEGKRHYARVHRLVALHFLAHEEEKPFVNHKDGDKLNNHYSNLEFCTNSYNTKHGYDNNLYKSRSRCEIEVYDKNWNYINTYPSIRSLSDNLNINRKTVTSILKGVKKTNNYKYNFKYKQKSQETIENIV